MPDLPEAEFPDEQIARDVDHLSTNPPPTPDARSNHRVKRVIIRVKSCYENGRATNKDCGPKGCGQKTCQRREESLMPSKRTKALMILSAALLIVIGITWTELNNYKQGKYESYRGERSAFNQQLSSTHSSNL